MASETEILALHLVRAVYNATDGQPMQWRSLEGLDVPETADTALAVDGATAQHWMTIVQCFAGPPEDPPKPGTRRRSRAYPGRQ